MFRGMRVELLSVAILPLGIGMSVQGSFNIMTPELTMSSPIEAGPVSYTQQVSPLFQSACGDCHGGDEPELGLDLTSYEAAMEGSDYGSVIEAGDADGSLLIDMIVAGEMPVDADPLSEEEIEMIRSWIDAGAENN